MISKLDFFNNRYFVKVIDKEHLIALVEVPKTFMRFYLTKPNEFDFNWLVSKCSVIYINLL